MAPTVYFTVERIVTATAHEAVDLDDLWDYSLSECMEDAVWDEVDEQVGVIDAEAVPD